MRGESEHRCRRHLPKPRRFRLTQVRACPCGLTYTCQRWGILAPTPMWLRVDLMQLPKATDESHGLVDRNLRVLQHEAETPMRKHDANGECCLRAAMGLQPHRAASRSGEQTNDGEVGA